MTAALVVEKYDVHGSDKNKKALRRGGLCTIKRKGLLNFALVVLVAGAEFINATGGINQLNFAGVKRM